MITKVMNKMVGEINPGDLNVLQSPPDRASPSSSTRGEKKKKKTLDRITTVFLRWIPTSSQTVA